MRKKIKIVGILILFLYHYLWENLVNIFIFIIILFVCDYFFWNTKRIKTPVFEVEKDISSDDVKNKKIDHKKKHRKRKHKLSFYPKTTNQKWKSLSLHELVQDYEKSL